MRHIEAVEDAVQSALMRALETWTIAGLPDKPSAWLFRVAHNELMGELRQRTSRRRILEQNTREDLGTPEDGPEVFLTGEMRDDLLRMLFVCCDEAIPVESQLVLALKTLCGFSTREIAIRLFTSEANVYKRLGRARNRLRTLPPGPGELDDEQYSSRLPAVHKICICNSPKATFLPTRRWLFDRSCVTKQFGWQPSSRNIQSAKLQQRLRCWL